MKTAIFVDGAFFLKRLNSQCQKNLSAKDTAKYLYTLCLWHCCPEEGKKDDNLYRIFFYDSPPLEKKVHNPKSKICIDLGKSEAASFKKELFLELKKKRKLALRLGRLQDCNGWILKPGVLKLLLQEKKQFSDLTDDDFKYDVHQKQIDMKIGIDIASVAYKKQVERIVLIAGDSDFVPAAKLARREGIDFILDPMWQNIHPDLHEHIDGLKSRGKSVKKSA